MQGQWSTLGCASTSNAACLCSNVNFGYGIRDCANGACGTAVGNTVMLLGARIVLLLLLLLSLYR